MHLWVEPAAGERKSANVEQKMVTLIYPYPAFATKKKRSFMTLAAGG
jgi:hypothetical protein